MGKETRPPPDQLIAQAADGLRSEEADLRYRALFEAGVVGIAIADETRFVEANDAFLAMVGYSRAELEEGRMDWREMSPPEFAENDAHTLRALDEEGRRGAHEKEFLRKDGTRVPVLLAVARLSREPIRAVGVIVDLSERRRGERERELLLAREREARLLAESSADRIARLQRAMVAVAGALTADEVGQQIVAAAVRLLDGDAGLLGTISADAEVIEVSNAVGYQEHKLTPWLSFPLESEAPLANCLRERRVITVPDTATWERDYPAMAPNMIEFPALVNIPLPFAGRVLGAIAVSWRTPQRFTVADIELMGALGRQCALAVERARLFEQRAYVARTLQAGLLPETLAEIPGAEVAVSYHSITDGGEVGGDFYDLFEVAHDRWVLIVGDVCGKGTQAAVLTGLARATIRAIALRERDPQALLAFLNEAILSQRTSPAFVSVCCASVERAGAGFDVVISSGGHPWPLVLTADGSIRTVEVSGTLLGVAPDPFLEQVRLRLDPGDALIAYTDGVTDARSPDGGDRFGDARLAAALTNARGGSAQAIVDHVDAIVRAFAPGPVTDDAALVVFRVAG